MEGHIRQQNTQKLNSSSRLSVSKILVSSLSTFTFMHSADAFFQSDFDFQRIHDMHFISMSLGIKFMTLALCPALTVELQEGYLPKQFLFAADSQHIHDSQQCCLDRQNSKILNTVTDTNIMS